MPAAGGNRLSWPRRAGMALTTRRNATDARGRSAHLHGAIFLKLIILVLAILLAWAILSSLLFVTILFYDLHFIFIFLTCLIALSWLHQGYLLHLKLLALSPELSVMLLYLLDVLYKFLSCVRGDI